MGCSPDAPGAVCAEGRLIRGSRVNTAEATTRRFDVQSADGTSLAVWVEGVGPPLVLVHGSLQDHTASGLLVHELQGSISTFSMDRRGFGASGDAAGYSIEREFEDVAAVVDSVAARTGGPVALWGHSYGASCAMGGAALTTNVHHLVLYEPSLGLAYPPGSIQSIEEKVAAGDMEGALLEVLVDIVGMTDEEVETVRSSPQMPWEARLATVPTVLRECRAEEGWIYEPGQFSGIAAPTVLLAGSESPPALSEATRRAADAIPNAHIRVLERHAHIAHRTDPAMIAAIVREFIAAWLGAIPDRGCSHALDRPQPVGGSRA
jgi:pimeloyl-ACP methyl ester carboxylesterase